MLKSVPQSLIPSPVPTASTRLDIDTWPELRTFFEAAFRHRTRDDWTSIYIGTDACCVPVLTPVEVDSEGLSSIEPGNTVDEEGSTPVPTPRLSRTPARSVKEWQEGETFIISPGRDTRDVMKEAGLGDEVEALVKEGVMGASKESKL